MNKFKASITLSVLLVFHANQAWPQDSCSQEIISKLESSVKKGDYRAQYELGIQLELGTCGTKDHKRAGALFQQSAAQSFPPAVHVLGIISRRDGHLEQALEYFELSAQHGYKMGFADMGFTYGLGESPLRDAVLSYAWLTIAIAREPDASLREYLDSSRAKVKKALSKEELVRAQSVVSELERRFSSVPEWSDNQ